MKKILIVDDEYDIVEPLCALFRAHGFHADSVTKGDETYAMVGRFQPDIILLDILMSGSDGRTICLNLKHNPTTKQIPIIMMSAHPSAQKDSEGSEADAFIAKPFDTKDLLNLVTSII